MSIVHKKLKLQAIELRGRGRSYNEILRKVPVAKSTLSLWLRSMGLSKKQIHKLSEKKRLASIKGGETRRKQRVLLIEEINKQGLVDIKSISKRELWLMGIMLYWGEGAKAKEHNVSQGIIFSNTDPLMINMFIKWLKDCVQVRDNEISFEIYIHIKASNGIEQVKKHWASKTGFSKKKFVKI